jgi:hypothetical protein
MGLTFPGLGYYCYIPIEVHMQRKALTILLYAAIMGHADPWIYFRFSIILYRERLLLTE